MTKPNKNEYFIFHIYIYTGNSKLQFWGFICNHVLYWVRSNTPCMSVQLVNLSCLLVSDSLNVFFIRCFLFYSLKDEENDRGSSSLPHVFGLEIASVKSFFNVIRMLYFNLHLQKINRCVSIKICKF